MPCFNVQAMHGHLTPPLRSTDANTLRSLCKKTSLTASIVSRKAGVHKPRPCWPGTSMVRGRVRLREAGGRGVWWWRRRATRERWSTVRSETARSLSGPGSGIVSWCVPPRTRMVQRTTTPPWCLTFSVSEEDYTFASVILPSCRGIITAEWEGLNVEANFEL